MIEIAEKEKPIEVERIQEIEERSGRMNAQELIAKWESAKVAAEFYGKGKTEELVKYMNEFIADLKSLNEPNKAEPHLFNIAGHMMAYKNSGTLNEYGLIDLIDSELNAFYNKEEVHPILKAFDDKADEYKNFESTSRRLQEIRKVIVKVIEEEQVEM